MHSIFKKTSKLTPKGTPSQPVRLNTKHKRVEYGAFLIARASERRVKRLARHARTAGETI